MRCIWLGFLFKADFYFKVALAAIYLSGTIIFSGGHLQWSSIFKGTVGLRVLLNNPFDELHFFYYKKIIAASHSFKFTVFAEQEL